MGSPNTSSTSSLTPLISFIVLIMISYFPLNCYSQVGNGGKIKGMFVFGSSLVDNGNNNFLEVRAKTNFLPYGIDFKDGPTGRWNNGKNVVDVLCDSLDLPLIPPFHDPSTTGARLINGVDYASGGSGVFDSTGTTLGKVEGMNLQIQNFEGTLSQLEAQLGKKSEEFLQNYIILVGTGGNDITTNYFHNATRGTVQDFTNNLVLALSLQLKKLYSLGGRKFVIMSANPLGCYPSYRNATSCNEEYNNAAILFNSQLKSMVDSLPKELIASHFVFVDSYQIIMDLINNPTPQGFQNVKDSCLMAGWKACENRKEYIFFDKVHPTEAVNLIVGSKAFSSNLTVDVYPINVQQLSML